MKFNILKRKFCHLIERIKLSESDYLAMKAQSQMYIGMMSTIKCSVSENYEDVTDAAGVLITQILKSKTSKININVTELLAEGGITFDKNTVELNIAT